jgi:biotin carboxyl carrier protein
MESMICDFLKIEEKLEVRAPSIGRIKLSVKLHDHVTSGQVIGEIHRLSKSFLLKLPNDAQGEVSFIKSDDLVPVQYGEVFLALNTIKAEHAGKKSTKSAEETYIDSPLDGLFYLSPSPDSPAFVKVGDEIAPGQVLGLIEVMKCFYPLKYQGNVKAKILSIKVLSQTPVNSGTPLFGISPA